MNTNEEIKPEELDVTLPSSILEQNEEDDDSDMPKPETAEYGNPQDNKKLMPTPKFYFICYQVHAQENCHMQQF